MEKIKFYFNRQKHAEMMRFCRLALMYAEDILKAVEQSKIEPTEAIIKGLYNVRVEKAEFAQNGINVVGVKNEAPKLYRNVVTTSDECEKAFEAYICTQLSGIPKALHKKYREDLQKIVDSLKDECLAIRHKWTVKEDFTKYVPDNVITYDGQAVQLDINVLNEMREKCNVYARDERSVKVFKAIEKAAKALNCIVNDVNTPALILDSIVQDKYDGTFTVAEIDYNTL